jgi:hypothetical protein
VSLYAGSSATTGGIDKRCARSMRAEKSAKKTTMNTHQTQGLGLGFPALFTGSDNDDSAAEDTMSEVYSPLPGPSRQRRRSDEQGSELVEHQVHDDAGHGDIRPDGKRDASELAMRFEVSFYRQTKCRDHEGKSDHREQRMRGEDEEVDAPDKPEFRKLVRTRQTDSNQVGHEKNGRNDDGALHSPAVHLDAFTPNREPAGKEQHAARCIEQCIDRGKHVAHVRGVHGIPFVRRVCRVFFTRPRRARFG